MAKQTVYSGAKLMRDAAKSGRRERRMQQAYSATFIRPRGTKEWIKVCETGRLATASEEKAALKRAVMSLED